MSDLTHPHVERLEGRTLLAAGDPDLSFGAFGVASVNFTGDPFIIHDVALQPDGKLVVAGRKGSDTALTRFNVNGTIDDTFGAAGLLILDRPGASGPWAFSPTAGSSWRSTGWGSGVLSCA